MFEERTVIKTERMTAVGRVLWIVTGLCLMFIAGFIVAVKLMGPIHPEPIAALPEGKVFPEFAEPATPTDFDEPWVYASLDEEIDCLAKNLYFEGRGESIDGQLGINFAVINRVKSKHYDNSICKVVYRQDRDKRSGKMTAQFSWTLDGKSDKIGNKELYAELRRLSAAMLAEGRLDNFVDITNGATHYHADYVDPYWANEETKVAVLDTHIFYDLYR